MPGGDGVGVKSGQLSLGRGVTLSHVLHEETPLKAIVRHRVE